MVVGLRQNPFISSSAAYKVNTSAALPADIEASVLRYRELQKMERQEQIAFHNQLITQQQRFLGLCEQQISALDNAKYHASKVDEWKSLNDKQGQLKTKSWGAFYSLQSLYNNLISIYLNGLKFNL